MRFLDRLENIYGETADVYETENGAGVVILEGSRTHHNFCNTEDAFLRLYKMGYQF